MHGMGRDGAQVPGEKLRDGGNPIERCQGKSFLQETSVMPGQVTTHVYGQDSTHVHTHV